MAGTESALSVRAAHAVRIAETVDDAVRAVRSHFGFDHATYHLGYTIDAAIDAPFVKSTYSDAWMGRYILKRYVNVDPVVQHGFRRQLPFFWSELPMAPQAMELMQDAIAHGVGTEGYTIPIIDRVRRRALLSLTTTQLDPALFRRMVEAERIALAELAFLIHEKAIGELHGTDPLPALAARELECLTWSAEGRTYKEIARLLDISEHTARAYLRSARLKLGCGSIAEAVAKAIRFNLIEDQNR